MNKAGAFLIRESESNQGKSGGLTVPLAVCDPHQGFSLEWEGAPMASVLCPCLGAGFEAVHTGCFPGPETVTPGIWMAGAVESPVPRWS